MPPAPTVALADRIEAALAPLGDVTRKAIVGGVGFMWRGNLLCSVLAGDLLVRVGAAGSVDALAQPGTRPMRMGARSSTSWVIVDSEMLRDDVALDVWLERGRTCVAALPPK